MATNSLGTLTLDLVARIGGYTKGLDSAEREAKKRAKAIERAFKDAGDVIGTAFAGAAIAGVYATQRIVDGLDALNDAADATGASIENLSALEDVAARTGTSFDTVTGAVVKFNQSLANTKAGDDVANALKAIGLNAAELKRLDPAEALRQTAVALARFADDGDKARLVQELFGKSVREVAPFLKDLAEQGALVATVTTEQAKEAEKFNQQLSALGKNATDAGRALTTDLVRGINEAAKAFKESGLLESLKTLFLGTKEHQANVAFVDLTNQLLEAENRLARGRERGFGAKYIETQEKSIAYLKQQLSLTQQLRTEADPMDVSDAMSRRLGRKPGVGVLPPKGSGAKVKAAKDSDKFSAADALRMEQEMLDEAQQAWAKYEKASTAAISSTYTEMEALRMEQEMLNEAQEFYAKSLVKNSEETKKVTEELGMTFASAFESAVIGGAKLSDVFKGLARDIAQLALRLMVTEPLMKSLKESISSAGGSGGAGSLIGSFISGIFGGARAGGGPVEAGKTYMVGERGMEMFTPAADGNITPAGGGSGGGLTIVNQTSGRIDRVQEREISPGQRAIFLQEAVETVASQMTDPNSKISRSMGQSYDVRRRR